MRNHTKTVLLVLNATLLTASTARTQEAANTAEFTLTDFRGVKSELSFKRPTYWTQDSTFKGGTC